MMFRIVIVMSDKGVNYFFQKINDEESSTYTKLDVGKAVRMLSRTVTVAFFSLRR